MKSIDFSKHCVLYSWSFVVVLYLGNYASASPIATLFGLAAAEADFLTVSSGDLSTKVGSDGRITVIGKSVTDGFTDHGIFDATWIESSNGVEFQASGTNYVETMSCSVDTAEISAECSFSNSVGGQGTFTGTFEPTAVPVLAVLTSSAQITATISFPQSSSSPIPPPPSVTTQTFVPSSTINVETQTATITFPSENSSDQAQPVNSPTPLPNPNGPFTLFGLDAAEADFLTAAGANRFTSVGADGRIAVIGKGVTDAFVDHGTFDAVWQESSNGVVFQATGDVYSEFMTCSVDQTAGTAACSFANSVNGQGAFSGTFQPTSLAFIATVTPTTESVPAATVVQPQDSLDSVPAQTVEPFATVAAPGSTLTAAPNPLGPFTLFGLAAAEADFLTQNGIDKSTIVGTNGVITVIGKGVTDDFVDHGTFTATWQESSNGVEFHATGDIYNEFMTCSVDQPSGLASCSFSNSVGTQGTFTGTFNPTAVPILATVTPGTIAAAATGILESPPPAVPAIASPHFIQGGPSSSVTIAFPTAQVQAGAAASGFVSLPSPPSSTDSGNDASQSVNNSPPGSGARSFSHSLIRVVACGSVGIITALYMSF